MIQCNVATGHYPIREIVLRALISDAEIHNPAEVLCKLASHWSDVATPASDWLRSPES